MYTVIETESMHPEYLYHEDYRTQEEAFERMRQMYGNIAIEGNPEVVRSGFGDDNAMVEAPDGNQIWWRILEINPQNKED